MFSVFSLIVLIFLNQTVETFFDFGSRVDCPTRNQSYDIRGDIYTIPHRMDFVWLNSGFGPNDPQKCPQRRLMELETMI